MRKHGIVEIFELRQCCVSLILLFSTERWALPTAAKKMWGAWWVSVALENAFLAAECHFLCLYVEEMLKAWNATAAFMGGGCRSGNILLPAVCSAQSRKQILPATWHQQVLERMIHWSCTISWERILAPWYTAWLLCCQKCVLEWLDYQYYQHNRIVMLKLTVSACQHVSGSELKSLVGLYKAFTILIWEDGMPEELTVSCVWHIWKMVTMKRS